MRKLMKIIFVSIFPLVICIAFFTTIDIDSNKCGWMCFTFVLLAYVLLLLTRLSARFKDGINTLNFNMWSISIVYFLLTLITDCLFLYPLHKHNEACMLINLFYILIYGVTFSLSYLSNKKIEESK